LGAAAGNPLRLVPWADISQDEAALVRGIVRGAAALLRELSAQETVELKAHVGFLRSRLEGGMRGLPEPLRKEIQAKIDGFSIGLEGKVDAEGLIDVVSMLLGRQADIDPLSGESEREDTVGQLRNLDALGLTRSARSIHLANLADGAFP